ncbi:PREDICTED: putative disease resistance protein At3g14460 [Camelina sativa]|uniref:Disease resistance protein At3g14460 n=1 Tax=Camelina sativa TaxID=90675 RepID=A0ABM0VWX2_CAMSA|nr:PREDICTED: putative disease resistance protein At3g14460 [Camelina sativa]
MHDLMNDLAKTVAVDFCYRLEDESLVQQIPKRVRHISFCGKQWDSSVASTLIRGAKYLRTFLPLVVSSFGCSKLVEKALDPLPDFSEQTLRCLRILSLSHYHITRLPESFEGLMTLRYLDLSNTEVIEIPAFVMGLHNLQTLFLSNCRQLRTLTASIVDLINLRYLVLLRTPLVEMPLGISKLTSLQNLSNFVVANLNGASLEELRELSHLRGTLHISELQNVVTLEEASAACLREKPLLKKLVLTWNMKISGCNTIACEQSGLLRMLQPHHNLKKVSINSYGGATFPKWLGHTSFTSMTSVYLTSCSLCILLPSLGQLPKLKYLSIEKFKILQKIGLEFFYGENDSVSTLEPFPCLEDLSFYDMPRWEEWRCPELEGRIFPRLDKLTIKSCPRLTKKFLKGLPDSTKVDYGKTSEPYLPRNKELHSENKELCRPESEISSLGASSSDAASTYGKRMPQADEDETGFESIKVIKVPQLKKVSASIKRLHIEGCLREKSLPESLLQDCPSLQELLVVSCHSLEALPGEYPSTTLKTLYIRDCMKLEFLETVQTNLIFPQLEDLFIDTSCSNLQVFPFASFQNLRSLSLRHCEKLSGFTVARHDVRLALESLEIMDCPMLKLFSSGLGTLKLTSLLISNCGNLKKLPPDLKEFTSLLSIHINECPEVQHVVFYASGYYGFPKSLQTLCINFCTKLRPMAWELNKLPNLRDVQIKGGNDDVKSFPPDENLNLLPWGLNSLLIGEFKNLRTLNNKALRALRILRMLEISGCDKLASLPDEGFPSSLSLLRINGCPILKEKIFRKKIEWFKIKHIQRVVIDGEELMR